MALLRFVRFLCGLAALAAFIFGFVWLFRGEWGGVGLCALAWLVAMLIFAVAQNGVERIERGDVAVLLSGVESMLARGDWQGALTQTTKATEVLSKSVKTVGNRSDQAGPLASALVIHSLVLGGNGDLRGAEAAASRAAQLLARIPNPNHHGREVLENVREIEDGLRACNGDTTVATQFCRGMV